MKGRVKELRDKINELKTRPGGAPRILPPVGCSVENICQFIGSLLSMIAALMKKEIEDNKIIQVEREIKIFLSNLDIVQKSLKDRGKIEERILHTTSIDKNNKEGQWNPSEKDKTDSLPFWLVKYNFQSLLNLPETIKLFGPISNLWEGGNNGEGILWFVKPRITNISSPRWQVNTHVNLLKDMSIKSTVHDQFCSNYEKDENMRNKYKQYHDGQQREKNMYVKYKTVGEFYSSYRNKQPISLVATNNGLFMQ